MKITEEELEYMVECLNEVEEPRRRSGNFRHKLIDILVIGLCTVISRGESPDEMEDMGKVRIDFFKTFLELPNGIPDSCTFQRVFERVKPNQLMKALQQWLGENSDSGGRLINIDGKTMRGSGKEGGRSALHVVSAWVGEHNLVLGQVETEEKSNEITAIPELLDSIDVEGDTVTIDAIGCQSEIAAKIRKKKADYILAVKENQPSLYHDIEDYFHLLEHDGTTVLPDDVWQGGLEKDHGRIEKREVRTVAGLEWLAGKKNWKDLQTIIQYRTTRTIKDKSVQTDHYYISSAAYDALEFGKMIRAHWSIENNLHWSLDVFFREDACHARKDNFPLNMTVMRKVALPLLKAVPMTRKRISMRRRMFTAALDPNFLKQILFGS
jgi:predicted transposase YbfD/YdcC